jgi:acyl-CoA reductase-like NAD-dependent aldehyde dehydrogenase
MVRNYDSHYIGGAWVPCRNEARIEVISASSEEVIGRIPVGDSAEADCAVQAARRAFEDWAARPAAERAEYLRKIQRGLQQRADEIADCITGELGMPRKLSLRIQTGSPITIFGFYADLLEQHRFENEVGGSLVIDDPVGVVACITPWNYPLHQIAAKVAPAIAAGCTVVLKPSVEAPLNAFLFAEVCHEAGLPPGVFNLICGTGRVVGEALALHPEVDMVSLTGSTKAGKRVAALAAESIKRVALELGGKSASVILDDADLKTAVKGTLSACFLNSGQTCSAHTRMLVPEQRYSEVATIAAEIGKTYTVGDPFAGQARLGPLVSATQRETVQTYIRKGIADGAELLIGGPDNPEGLERGYYVKPTIFGHVDPQSVIAQEEIFVPVLSIITYTDEDDAIRIANGTPYGLAGAVWSNDQSRALRVARRMRTGQVDVNGASFNYGAPFGGFKQSGYGRELGAYGLEEFLEPKSVQLSRG